MLTQSRLKTILHYDPETGMFRWRVSNGAAKAGRLAGSLRPNGYLHIGVDCNRYYSHRLAWLYVYGVWPKDQLDHINGIPNDNRIANLREATPAENHQNRKKHKNNTSGFQGVHWDSKSKKWMVLICHIRKRRYVGRYDTPEAARAAYLIAKAELHTFNPTLRG